MKTEVTDRHTDTAWLDILKVVFYYKIYTTRVTVTTNSLIRYKFSLLFLCSFDSPNAISTIATKLHW